MIVDHSITMIVTETMAARLTANAHGLDPENVEINADKTFVEVVIPELM
jgi:hypothetical protein|tara:strand:- start:386 stop:532 length:147 start_codon:yes stop_codon:yes gene_type:complete